MLLKFIKNNKLEIWLVLIFLFWGFIVFMNEFYDGRVDCEKVKTIPIDNTKCK